MVEIEPIQDFKIVNETSIKEILDNFKYFSKLYSPLVKFKTEYKEIWTVPRVILSDKREAFPVFTDYRMLNAPYVFKPTFNFLSYLLSSMKTGATIFNPPIKKEFKGKQIIVDLYTISLALGFLQYETGRDKDENIIYAINKGFLHKANYLCFKNLPDTDKFIYSEILTLLGFIDKAYELIKPLNNERALLTKAFIDRIKGDYKSAALSLENVKSEQFVWEKNLHLAWLNLFSGNIDYAKKIFSQLSGGIFKQEAFWGLAVAILSKPNLTKDEINQAIAYLTQASNLDGKNKINILIYLGNLYYNMQEYIKAENCYYKALDINPSIQIISLIGICEAKRGKYKEAMTKANLCSIFDINSAIRILSILPQDYVLNDNTIDIDIIFEEPAKDVKTDGTTKNEIKEEKIENTVRIETTQIEASLEPADITSVKKTEDKNKKTEDKNKTTERISIQTNFESFSTIETPKQDEKEKFQVKDFLSRAIPFSNELGEELNKKIYFNQEGLIDIERKLRITFVRENLDQTEAIETVKNCSAFLCYFLKERYKAKLIEYEDLDPWAWPMIIPISNTEIWTFPIARIWKILWNNTLPEQGWILKYVQYLIDEMSTVNKTKPSGLEAIKSKTKSHTEKIFDAQIEHKKNLTVASSLDETKDIEIAKTGLLKMEIEIKKHFKPQIPPSADGWRLLRCFGHILAEIMIKDFKASWFNVEGNDGLWSMELPWKTYIFPVGKIFKMAANGESLVEYYDKILNDRFKHT